MSNQNFTKTKKCSNKVVRDDSCSNFKNKLTLEILAESHNALARYIGIPCVLDYPVITNTAAIPSEQGSVCEGFGGYRIPLASFKGDFSEIKFRGAGNNDNVVCGYIVDKEGNIETVAEVANDDDGSCVLPVTPNSRTLYASVPFQDGKPVWENIDVELQNQGLYSKFTDAILHILERIIQLEAEVEQLKK